MRRRDFIAGLGAAAWPLGARAQQAKAPVVGVLEAASRSPDVLGFMRAFHKGLGKSDYVEGRNVAIEYRWAEGHYDRLPTLTAELVAMRVAVLVIIGTDAGTRIAKQTTATIPIVFATGADPVQLGLVASLNRPGGNVTGATWFTSGLAAKRLGLMRVIVPKATTIGMLVNPDNARAAFETKDVQEAARSIGWQVHLVNANNERAFEPAFASFSQRRVGALLIVGDFFFSTRAEQLVALAARHSLPTIYSSTSYVAAGGLMSYGANLDDTYGLAGNYVGRILKGAKPADLPVQLPTKFAFVLNAKTAKALGLEIPSGLLSIADEVIE
jgi:putative ABC transport system substrate-binding protein